MKKYVLIQCVCLGVVILSCALNSCNVTRTVTTSSQYYQKGDTTTQIMTKTIETYDATKK